MAKSTWSLENFLSQVGSRGLAKPNRFEVSITTPPCVQDIETARTVSMFCDQAYLPMYRILTSRQQLFGTPSFHPVGLDVGGENASMQFYVDREMKVKRYFDSWVQGIIDPVTFTAKYRENYVTDILISQLDEQDDVMYCVKLIDAWPMNVNALTLDQTAANTVHKLTVSFVYKRWEVIELPASAPESSKENIPSRIQIRNGTIYNNFNNISTPSGGSTLPGVGSGAAEGYYIVR